MTQEEQAAKDAAHLRKVASMIENHHWRYRSILKSGDAYDLDQYKETYRSAIKEALIILGNNLL